MKRSVSARRRAAWPRRLGAWLGAYQETGQLAVDVDLAGVDRGLDPVQRGPHPGDVLVHDGALVLAQLPVPQAGDGAACGRDEGVAGRNQVEELNGPVDLADYGGDGAGPVEVDERAGTKPGGRGPDRAQGPAQDSSYLQLFTRQ